MTSSPSFNPIAIKEISSASVPDETSMQFSHQEVSLIYFLKLYFLSVNVLIMINYF